MSRRPVQDTRDLMDPVPVDQDALAREAYRLQLEAGYREVRGRVERTRLGVVG